MDASDYIAKYCLKRGWMYLYDWFNSDSWENKYDIRTWLIKIGIPEGIATWLAKDILVIFTDGSGSGTSNFFRVINSITPGAGSANFRNFIVEYTINASGANSGTATGIFLNATETALNGMTHNLMDLQKGSVSQFKVTNAGALIAVGYLQGSFGYFSSTGVYLGNGAVSIASSGSNKVVFYDAASTGAPLVQLGGTTNAFPAIKRNGAAIDFRLADDSGYAAINAGVAYVKGSGTSGTTNALLVQNGAGTNLFRTRDDGNSFFEGGGAVTATGFVGTVYGLFGGLAYSPSVVLGANSTVAGFLPPRMTTAQKNAIGTPPAGLVVYDTTLNKLCVYTTAWETVTSI